MVKNIFIVGLLSLSLWIWELPVFAEGVRQVSIEKIRSGVFPVTVVPGMELQIDVSSLGDDPVSQVTWGNTQLIGCEMVEVNKVVKAIRVLALAPSGETNLTIWTAKSSLNFMVTVREKSSLPFVLEIIPEKRQALQESKLVVSQNTQRLIKGLASAVQKPKLEVFYSVLETEGLSVAIEKSGMSAKEIKALYDKALEKE
jgi:hypothetical protein